MALRSRKYRRRRITNTFKRYNKNKSTRRRRQRSMKGGWGGISFFTEYEKEKYNNQSGGHKLTKTRRYKLIGGWGPQIN